MSNVQIRCPPSSRFCNSIYIYMWVYIHNMIHNIYIFIWFMCINHPILGDFKTAQSSKFGLRTWPSMVKRSQSWDGYPGLIRYLYITPSESWRIWTSNSRQRQTHPDCPHLPEIPGQTCGTTWVVEAESKRCRHIYEEKLARSSGNSLVDN